MQIINNLNYILGGGLKYTTHGGFKMHHFARQFCNENLKKLEELNKQYIVGARIRNLPDNIKEEILDLKSYKAVNNSTLKTKIIGYKKQQKQQLVLSWSPKRAKPKRAKKDEEQRKKNIEKLKTRLKDSEDPQKLYGEIS